MIWCDLLAHRTHLFPRFEEIFDLVSREIELGFGLLHELRQLGLPRVAHLAQGALERPPATLHARKRLLDLVVQIGAQGVEAARDVAARCFASLRHQLAPLLGRRHLQRHLIEQLLLERLE